MYIFLFILSLTIFSKSLNCRRLFPPIDFGIISYLKFKFLLKLFKIVLETSR